VRIRLSEPSRLRQLMIVLAFDPSAIVTQLSDAEIEVSFLGSLNANAQLMETELRLRAWLAAHPDVSAVLSE
jgi:hypothetical protein